MRISAVATRLDRLGCFLAALLRQRLGEDGDKGRRQRAFGEQVAREIGDAEAEQEGVVDEAGAEQAGHDDFAQESGDPRHCHRHGDNPRRSNHALGRSRILRVRRHR